MRTTANGKDGQSQPVSAERRLPELGVILPDAPHPLGAYVEAVQTGNLLFLVECCRSRMASFNTLGG